MNDAANGPSVASCGGVTGTGAPGVNVNRQMPFSTPPDA